MNTRRIFFWLGFLIVLALIIWGLVVAMKKSSTNPDGPNLGVPAAVNEGDHAIGPNDAKVTVIEYSDFQCPACESYYPIVTRLYNESSSTMRLVYRHFPLSQHPNAIPSALAAEAASAQGKFWPMYDMIFENHTDWTELPNPTSVFVGYATKLGLNIERFTNDLSSSTLKKKINDQQDEGISLGINGTPTFFVNGKAISNPTYEQFKAIIEAAATSSPQ